MQRFLAILRSNWITATGAVVTTLAFMAFVTTLVYVAFYGGSHGAYLGLFAFLVVPAVFVLGIVLVPLGLLLYRGRFRERMAKLRGRPMRLLPILGILTVVNLATMGTAGFEAARYMDSPQFCGTVCHMPMYPTFVSSLDAPHSNIACVECHIGPGIGSFLEAKLNGMRQVALVALDDFNRPIPTPVHGMRPAREICESCHSTDKVRYDRLVVRRHYAEDDEVSETFNVLLMRIGEKDENGVERGIHWHTNSDVDISFVSADGRRTIPWVRYVDAEGNERIYGMDGDHLDARPEGELRRMDCIDCHNRAAHHQQDPANALDEAIAAGRIPRRLPGIRRLAMATLKKPWQRDTARAEIRRDLELAYAADGGLDAVNEGLLQGAADAVADIWLRNVHPEMNVTWGTYPNFIGHAGCLRCHDGLHEDADGEVISFECASCHTVLAEDEKEPAVLELLGRTGK